MLHSIQSSGANARAAICAALAANLFPATALSADLRLEEVIVTAQKRAENLQDVPVSVSVVTGALIADNGIRDLEEMASYVPNLSINQGPSVTSIYIRGLGSGDNQGFDQSVGLFIDGVYAGRSRQFTAPFLDVGNVEVLRGPQGTLFGKNTIAGAMTISSAKPTDALFASLLLSYETEFDSPVAEAVLSGPLTDSLSGRVALKAARYNGFLFDTIRKQDYPQNDQDVLRLSLQWAPQDRDMIVDTKYERGETQLDGRSSKLINPGEWEPLIRENDPNFSEGDFKRSISADEFNNTENQSFTVNVSAGLGDYELVSITGYSEYSFEDSTDIDFSPIEIGALRIPQDFEQWSQEFRIASPQGERFDVLAGYYYQTNELASQWRLSSSFSQAAGGPITDIPFEIVPDVGFRKRFDQDSDTHAIFGSVNWHINESTTVNAGLRYTRERKSGYRELEFTDFTTELPIDEALSGFDLTIAEVALQSRDIFEHVIDRERDVDNFSPSLKIQYQLDDAVMVYASVSRAFKSGGFNEAGNKGDDPDEYTFDQSNPLFALVGIDIDGQLLPAPFEFDEEEALAYEIGLKSDLFDGRGTLNMALFRTEYDDLQVSNFSGTGLVVTNAAQAISQGLEFDSKFLISPQWAADLSFAYLDATYDNYPDATCTAQQAMEYVETQGDFQQNCRQDLSGRPLPYAPEWSGNLGLDYEANLGADWIVRVRGDLSYRGEQFLAPDLDPALHEQDHLLANLRIALANQRYRTELSLLVKNLTDETVRNAGNDPFLLEGTQFVYLNAPRTITLQARFIFQ